MPLLRLRLAAPFRPGAKLSSQRFKVNTPGVIHQTLDGEVIIVNLDTGTYYSVDGVGAEIWSAVERGASVQETVADSLRRYDAASDAVEGAVKRFFDELATEQLVVATNGDAAAPATDAAPPRAEGERYSEPVLNKYTDMQELLLLDPIHEVDETGWPNSLDDSPQPAP